jgi:hypothetical protein
MNLSERGIVHRRLKNGAAVENVKCLVRFDVVMRARLKSRFASTTSNVWPVSSPVILTMTSLALGVDVPRTRRRMLALHAFLHLLALGYDGDMAAHFVQVGWTPGKNSTTFDQTTMRSRNH